MPTYTYICEKCEKSFEHEKKISDPHPETCIYCKKNQVKQIIVNSNIPVFKGKGWFKTGGY